MRGENFVGSGGASTFTALCEVARLKIALATEVCRDRLKLNHIRRPLKDRRQPSRGFRLQTPHEDEIRAGRVRNMKTERRAFIHFHGITPGIDQHIRAGHGRDCTGEHHGRDFPRHRQIHRQLRIKREVSDGLCAES